ncbi:acyltransferase family protein [Micrococcus sp.]|uniref:acyltransferase family protein n=1 Tax=Micrococcus sp. TaxID=1271 RepID=UPI002A91FE8C|nr:acyltransferase family protein [Micrococcus sp.]MDY6054786.1 acyltransferase family protein [Micrococcus sp.]
MTTVNPMDEPALRPGVGRLRFRGDIQGLRAVAVLLVLIFHAGVPFLPGGFVGVDVFFVISGFLITGLLIRERARTGRIDLVAFYARRARRILPASLVVIVVTVLAAWFFLPDSQGAPVGWMGLWASLSVANWALARSTTDYFAAEEPASPLQHYWSLAVEEQYYLVWPLLVVVTAVGYVRLRRRLRPTTTPAPAPVTQGAASATEGIAAVRGLAASVGVVAAVAGAVSLLHSITFSAADPGAAYFVTTTRVWELALGALLACVVILLPGLSSGLTTVLGWAGLAAIVVSAVVFNGSMSYPGAAALLPVAGAAAVILAGAFRVEGRGVSRVLATGPMQWIGDLSYALYLVHWPLLVIVDWQFSEGMPLWVGLLTAVVSVPVAWLLRVAVEKPFLSAGGAHGNRAPRHARALWGGGVGMGVAAGASALLVAVSASSTAPAGEQGPVAGAAVVVNGHDPVQDLASTTRLVPAPAQASKDLGTAVTDGCQAVDAVTEPVLCHYGDEGSDTVIVLAGDSHAGHWSSALIPAAEQRGWHVVTLMKGACPVTTATVIRRSDSGERPFTECDEWNRRMVQEVAGLRPDLVIVSSARYLTVDGTPAAEGMAEAWAALQDAGAGRVVALMDPPHARTNVPTCLERNEDDPTACTSPRQDGVTASGTPDLERALELSDGVERLDLNDLICPGPVCAPVIGEAVVFSDSNHLTRTFAATLAEPLGERIQPLLPGA